MRVNLLYSVGIIGLFGILSCSGCSTSSTAHPRSRNALVNPRAAVHTVDYNSGYSAGCASGRNAVGDNRYKFNRDAAEYGASSEYSTGWDEGYALCQEHYLAEIQNKVKQDLQVSGPDNETTELREKIWNDLRK